MDSPTGLFKVEDAEGGWGACGFLFGEVGGSRAAGCLLETESPESFDCFVLGVLGESVSPISLTCSEKGSLTHAVSFLTGAPEGAAGSSSWLARGSLTREASFLTGGSEAFGS